MKHISQFPETSGPKKPHQLSEEPYIHPDCIIKDSFIGAYTSLGKKHLVG
jgi:hypothetical protein